MMTKKEYQELGEKIDYEGGLEEYFIRYADSSKFAEKDPELGHYIDVFVSAYHYLNDYLDDKEAWDFEKE